MTVGFKLIYYIISVKKEYLLIIPLVLVLGFWAVLLNNYRVSKTTTVKPKTALPTGVQITPNLSPNPTQTVIETKIAEVRQQGGTIPFDYEVISVGDSSAEITGLKGKVTLRDDPAIKFFFKKGEQVTTASFTDLKVGQKLTIEKSAPPANEFKVFILEE